MIRVQYSQLKTGYKKLIGTLFLSDQLESQGLDYQKHFIENSYKVDDNEYLFIKRKDFTSVLTSTVVNKD